MIPLCAMDYHLDRLTKLQGQIETQARISGMKIYLCKFQLVEIIGETEAGRPPKESLK